jgi:hypothetical protein
MQHSGRAVLRLISYNPGLFSCLHRSPQMATCKSKGGGLHRSNKQQAMRVESNFYVMSPSDIYRQAIQIAYHYEVS